MLHNKIKCVTVQTLLNLVVIIRFSRSTDMIKF